MVKKTEALKLAQDLRALADRFSEGWHDGIKIDASDIVLLSDAAEALAEQPAQQQEPYEIEWPEYHEHAMGCGLEDRDERCLYGAMRYGWDCAIEAVAQAMPDVIYTSPPPCPTCEALARTVMLDQTSHDTTPPQRKPLSNEKIGQAARDAHIAFCLNKHQTYEHALTRAIEAAHGIKGEA